MERREPGDTTHFRRLTQTPHSFPGAVASGIIVVLFCLILFWHNPFFFWNDDYQLSILPVFADVARSWSEGHLPLLSPYSWVCSNLAGEFEYGTFSIFVNAVVALIWKFPLTFPQQAAALSITHLFVLATGSFLLARDRLGLDYRTELPLPQSSPGGRGRPNIGDGIERVQTSTGGEERCESCAISFEPRLSSSAGRGGRQSCRARGISSIPLSIFVALVAALNGWIICWGATDWFGALGAFAWFPWAWWGLERATDESLSHMRQRFADLNWGRIAAAALFVYLLVTGGFPYTVLMLLVLVVWLSIRSLVQSRSFMSIWPMLLAVALGFGLSAPACLAIFDYVHGSARELQDTSAHWQWITPWRALPGFILPCWTVNWTNFYTRLMPHTATELTSGLVAPVALVAGFIWRGRILVRRLKWELLLLLLVLALSMLPTASLFRWSFRWLPFFDLALALCAAEGLRILTAENAETAEFQTGFSASSAVKSPGIVAIALVGVTAIVMSILHVGGPYAFPLTWIFLGLAALWALLEFVLHGSRLRDWIPAGVTFAALLTTYLCIPPNVSVPKFNLSQKLLEPSPLDQARLYLSVYPPPEFDYRVENKPGPIGQILRPGSTSMWARLRFVNGYSPISPAGVGRQFHFGTHGEIDPDVANDLLREQAGADGKLAQLGVDGIVIAREVEVDPQPASEWKMVFANDEGRVFHRRGPPFARVRSIATVDARTGEQFSAATISRINESRNRVEVDLDVPSGQRPALLIFSRPYFRGYQARMNNQKLTVKSANGLFPVIQIPPGTNGHLVLEYRPAWLIVGAMLACICAAILTLGLFMSTRVKADL